MWYVSEFRIDTGLDLHSTRSVLTSQVLFIVFVAVLTATARKHDASFVFLDSATASGWNNKFVSWNLGLLTPSWGFVGA